MIKILVLLVAMLAGYIAIRMLLLPRTVIAVSPEEPITGSEEFPSLPEAPGDTGFQEHQAVLESRDIFAVPYSRDNGPALESSAPPEPGTAQQLGDYRVIGLVLDDQPVAILEHIRTGETVFLSVGDKLENSVLEEIEDGKVIFNNNGQIMELTPR